MNHQITPREVSSDKGVKVVRSSAAPDDLSASAPWGERIFQGPAGMHLVWRILLYLVSGVAVVSVLYWLGKSFFPEPVYGAAALWQSMYGEAALMLGALLPAFLMGYIERRSVDEYGLPRLQAFGKLFWVGAVWGLVAITILLVAMRAIHVVSFGHVMLHGVRIVKFAAFWAVFFLLVGFFEEFLLRGYLLFTTAQRAGFWPTSALLSCAFGAIHLNNAGEGLVGALGAAAIGFFFCLTLRRTGNLWFAVGFHASWDWGETYLYAVPNSGTKAPGHLLSSSFSGNPWLTGGTVGPEGSVLCFALLIVLWVVFDRLYPTVMYKTDLPPRLRDAENTALGIAGTDVVSRKSPD